MTRKCKRRSMQGLITSLAIDNSPRAVGFQRYPCSITALEVSSPLRSFDLHPSGVVRALSVRCSRLQVGTQPCLNPRPYPYKASHPYPSLGATFTCVDHISLASLQGEYLQRPALKWDLKMCMQQYYIKRHAPLLLTRGAAGYFCVVEFIR